MPYRNLLCEIEGAVAIVTLNRPERRNALSLELIEELIQAFGEVGRNSEIRVAILAASGSVFCSGHDLRELLGREPEQYRRIFERSSELMRTLRGLPQPVIAEVQGVATAAGCQLVAACDLAIAAQEARFATPGVRIGLFCSTPMVPLARAVGRKRAFYMLATAEMIDAETAAHWGLVNRVAPAALLRRETLDLAQRLAQASPLALALGKRAFYEQLELSEAQAYAYTCQVMALNAAARDAQEGISAFLEKRPPRWSGC